MPPTGLGISLKNDRWSDVESNNVRVVLDFFQKLMNEHDFDYTLATYDRGSYIQHNRAIPPDIPGLVGYVKSVVRRYPDYAFDVKRVIASGDFVVLHSHATFKAKHRGIVDSVLRVFGEMRAAHSAGYTSDFGPRIGTETSLEHDATM